MISSSSTSTPSSSSAHSNPNDFSYFQYPPHRHAHETQLNTTNREQMPNQPSNNDSHPSCQYHYLTSNEKTSTRPLLPLSLVTVCHRIFCVQITIELFLLGCSNNNSVCSTSSTLSFRKSICSVIHSTSTLVRRRTRR